MNIKTRNQQKQPTPKHENNTNLSSR